MEINLLQRKGQWSRSCYMNLKWQPSRFIMTRGIPCAHYHEINMHNPSVLLKKEGKKKSINSNIVTNRTIRLLSQNFCEVSHSHSLTPISVGNWIITQKFITAWIWLAVEICALNRKKTLTTPASALVLSTNYHIMKKQCNFLLKRNKAAKGNRCASETNCTRNHWTKYSTSQN